MSTESLKKERMYDLDWLRVIAIIILLFFHAGMVFISWTWYFMQDSQTSVFLDEITLFFSHWRMALLFFISGAGTLFALGFRSGPIYLRERVKRLLIPLAFGVFIIIPPQIYFELLKHGWEFSSYLDFNQRYFEGGLYPLGDLSWHHLWFIGYLLLYSVIGFPVFLYLRSKSGKKVIEAIANFIEPTGRIYLLAIPLMAIQIALRDKFSGFHNVVDDIAGFTFFFLFFLYGYIICSNSNLWNSIQKQRHVSLLMGVATFLVLFFTRRYEIDMGYTAYWIIQTCVAWLWVLAILGYGRQHLNFNNKFLRYANEGIYPFYILHQTVLIIFAYYVIQWDMPVMFKYIILSLVTLGICILLYDLVIKRNNITRFLFGMKPLPANSYHYSKPSSVAVSSDGARNSILNNKIYYQKERIQNEV